MSPPPDDYDIVDLRDYVDLLISGRWTIALATAMVLAAGVGWTLVTAPIYEAQALIQVEDQRPTMPGFEQVAGLGAPSPIEAEQELLRSRLVLGQVVDQLDLTLHVRPSYFPVIGPFLARRYTGEGPAPARFGAGGRAWGGEQLKVDRLDLDPGLQGTTLTLIAEEEDRFTLLGPDGDILLEGEVGKAASGTDETATIFISSLEARAGTRFFISRSSRQRAVTRLRGSLDIGSRGDGGFLEVRLQGAEPDTIRRIVDEVANVYLRQHVERGSEEARSSLAFLDEQLPELRAQLEAAEERFNVFRREQQAVDLSADTQHLLNRLVEIESEIAELDLQLVEESKRFASEHPRIRTLREQRARLQATRSDLERRVDGIPDLQQEALRLRRDVEVSTQLYTNLLNTAQELRVVQAGTIGNVRIVDHAVTGETPVKPRAKLNFALSLVLGLMLGVGLVFARQALHRAVDDPDTLEQVLGMPVYTVIPHSKEEAAFHRKARSRSGPMPLLACVNPQDPAVEGLRSFRTSLHFALMEPGTNAIMITSPHAESGKSFVCVNAGEVFAATGKRVLVIDADLRRGRLQQYLERGREPGLTEVLAGRIEVGTVIERIEGTNVDLMTTGTLPPNPSELLMSSAWEKLLDEMREAYDLVIIDTPPVLAVTDAAIVGAKADAVFMLVRAGKSRAEEIESAVRRLTHNDLKVTGLLFNDMGARRSGYGAYRYQHYYRYDYTNRKGEGE